ncbi:sigma-70 family RNA polymerase sigma factor [uncultured Arthrobacter sp.]|uniref:RNA polymerase sigma factor n=1 Tax=uncultured Arthrobacter sp. TaxID=114050 RepID=UPI0032165719
MAPFESPSAWDARLNDAFAAGDETALAEAYRQFSPMVHTLALRSLRDNAAADDATQEVFIRVWRSRSAFDPTKARLPAWIVGITRNVITDAQAASTRETRKVLAAVELSPDRNSPPVTPRRSCWPTGCCWTGNWSGWANRKDPFLNSLFMTT